VSLVMAGESGMLMWGQICWRRKGSKLAMDDDDSLDRFLRLGVSRNPLDFSGAKRLHQGPIFSILPHGRRRLPHDRISIHEAKTEFVTFH